MPSNRQILLLFGLAIALHLVVVAIIGLTWQRGWHWLTECDRGPTKAGSNPCAYPNLMVLAVPLAIPFVYGMYRWRRYSRDPNADR